MRTVSVIPSSLLIQDNANKGFSKASRYESFRSLHASTRSQPVSSAEFQNPDFCPCLFRHALFEKWHFVISKQNSPCGRGIQIAWRLPKFPGVVCRVLLDLFSSVRGERLG